MVNLLGDLWYAGSHYREPDWSVLYAVPNLKLHLYGKHHARHGRKMGHFTVIGDDPAAVRASALAARAAIGIRGRMTPRDADYDRAVDLLKGGELVAFSHRNRLRPGRRRGQPRRRGPHLCRQGAPADHPLIVHVAGHDWVERWAEKVPAAAWELMEAFWPGPLTLILKKQAWVPAAVTGGRDTVGLRVPGHPVALELLRRFAAAGGSGGIAPSANRFGRISPTTADHVREELGGAFRWSSTADPAKSASNRLSSTAPGVNRPSCVPATSCRPTSKPSSASARPSPTPSAPPASRVPRSPLRAADAHAPGGLQAPPRFSQRPPPSRRPLRRPCHSQPPQAGMPHAWRMLPADPVGYAHDLYAALRDMDHAGVDMIAVEAIPDDPAWAAVADRLRRAAARRRQGLIAIGRGGTRIRSLRADSSAGRALRSQCRGREFDPPSVPKYPSQDILGRF